MNIKKTVIATTIFFVNASPAFACPFCKEALSKMGEIWTSIGFNLSVYVMLTVPFLLVGSFALILYLNYRKRGSS